MCCWLTVGGDRLPLMMNVMQISFTHRPIGLLNASRTDHFLNQSSLPIAKSAHSTEWRAKSACTRALVVLCNYVIEPLDRELFRYTAQSNNKPNAIDMLFTTLYSFNHICCSCAIKTCIQYCHYIWHYMPNIDCTSHKFITQIINGRW